jgi:uncharacterized protein YdeI (YjbR/CyaY-like superfamily)
MEITETLYVAARDEWRSWLEANHDKKTEIWLIYYKAGSGKPRIPYKDAVEEALCFGWIDGIVKQIDSEKYTQRYSPRKPDGNWSELNISIAEKLIAQGRMAGPGLKAYRIGLAHNTPERRAARMQRDILPEDLLSELKKNPGAYEYFSRLPPSGRRMNARYVNDAKRSETRQKRIGEVVALAAENKRIGTR